MTELTVFDPQVLITTILRFSEFLDRACLHQMFPNEHYNYA